MSLKNLISRLCDSCPGGNDLTTPQALLDVLYAAIGVPGLDPCSNRWSTVDSAFRLTPPKEDGLKASWGSLCMSSLGSPRYVYCNPPWGRGELIKWAEKAVLEASAGTKIAMLVPLDPTTAWCELLYHADPKLLLLKERQRYGGHKHVNPKSEQLLLLGPWSLHEVESLARTGKRSEERRVGKECRL